MVKAIMVQGTASNSGKTLLATALCRIFKQDGYRAVPFKSQNMALNSFVTSEGHEMGRAQAMQAEAAGIAPDVRMNPILLKPTSDQGSQVIVNGKSMGTMSAKDYFAYKQHLLADVRQAYASLSAEADIMVIEGAGSPAEINLKSGDIVNMGMAALAGSPVIIVGDIDRGGVFASLAGTMLLLTEQERAMVKGVVINKFRGDVDILLPGLKTLADMIQVPVLGVVPYLEVSIDDEDSLTERFSAAPQQGLVDIAVVRLPRIANFTDFNAFDYMDGVSLRYVRSRRELGSPDLIILPGTKNPMADLLWLRESGLGGAIMRHAQHKPIWGICGGFQILGKSIADPHGVAGGEMAEGLGLLPFATSLDREKSPCRREGILPPLEGIFEPLSGLPFTGYALGDCQLEYGAVGPASCRDTCHVPSFETCQENHGEDSLFTRGGEDMGIFFQNGHVYGSCIHGLFDSEAVAGALVSSLLQAKGYADEDIKTFDFAAFKETQYDLLAEAVRKSVDMAALYAIMEEGV